MKSLTLIITVLFIISLGHSQTPPPPPDPIIFIIGSDTSSGDLTLDPPAIDTTFVSRSNWVNWIVRANSGVQAIDSITPKDGSPNVFIQGHPTSNPSFAPIPPIWRGKINPNVEIGTIEDYRVYWKDSEGNQHTFDPSIKVNQ